jgi:ribonuclease P protein component
MWKKQTARQGTEGRIPSTAASCSLTYLSAETNFIRLCRKFVQTVLEHPWESQPTVRAIRGASRRTGSVRVWKRSGVVRRLLAAGRRDGSSSQSASRISTPAPETPNTSLAFPRRARITRGAELQRIAQEGKRIRTALFEVRVIASPFVLPPGTRTRIGLIVPRFHQSAVARNRVKRRLRELSRTRLLPTDLPAQIVIRIRPEAYRATFPALDADIGRILAQLVAWRALNPGLPPMLENPTDVGSSDT